MSAILRPLGELMERGNQLNSPYYSKTYEEITSMSILERCKLFNFSFEYVMLAVVVLIFIVYSFGKNANVKSADKIYTFFNNWLSTQFSTVGFFKSGEKIMYVEENSNTVFTTFATGRAYIESVTIKTQLLPKFNPLMIAMERLSKYYMPGLFSDSTDENMEIVIKPNNVSLTGLSAEKNEKLPSKFDFVSAIVSKNCMSKSRANNYFLSLTQAVESPNLPIEYVYMSETNQLNAIFKKFSTGKDITALLKKSRWFLNYIAFTDLPSEKPVTDTEWEKGLEPRCIISTKITTDPKDLALIVELIEYAFAIFENLTDKDVSLIFSGEISKKIKNLRTQESTKINKVMKEIALEIALEKKTEELKKKDPQAELALQAKRDRRKKNKQQRVNV